MLGGVEECKAPSVFGTETSKIMNNWIQVKLSSALLEMNGNFGGAQCASAAFVPGPGGPAHCCWCLCDLLDYCRAL